MDFSVCIKAHYAPTVYPSFCQLRLSTTLSWNRQTQRTFFCWWSYGMPCPCAYLTVVFLTLPFLAASSRPYRFQGLWCLSSFVVLVFQASLFFFYLRNVHLRNPSVSLYSSAILYRCPYVWISGYLFSVAEQTYLYRWGCTLMSNFLMWTSWYHHPQSPW